ncbi:carbohydrate kinase family protein [Brevibacillus daliensis]|uniref:carbohydrate kinase family protein n=1 Tax=Brevibacillus daliensis TaxID=2892995 RepID=UPI001E51F802|nr:PfkB family carbohydrate kinase [Brevibacillus daliensis]
MSHFLSVLGTVFIDVKGFAFDNYQAQTKNLGSIQFTHGGVGRNIAENLGRSGCPTAFVSVLETTGMGPDVENRLRYSNVHTEFSERLSHGGMGMWMVLLDEHGELQGSVSQQPDHEHMRNLLKKNGEKIVSSSSHIIAELDFELDILQPVFDLAKAQNKPIYGVAANLSVIMKHPDILRELDCFVCNNFEADQILGENFSDYDIAKQEEKLVEFVDKAGLCQMVITLGKNGSVYYDKATGESGHQNVFPVNVADSCGAGDAYFSGVVVGLSKGLSLKNAVICGTKIAGWTIESTESICTDLSKQIKEDDVLKEILCMEELITN